MENNKRCDICNLEISKSNWSKHLKTKKHLDNIQLQENIQTLEEESNIQKHCAICNILY